MKQTLQPLSGIRVLDFGHTVMGPCCGMILADLGAEVIKVEPTGKGDPTRYLKGFGSGYFGYFSRNKKSVSIDLKSQGGQEIARKLVQSADVLIENFAPGTMDRLGLSKDQALGVNPKLIYTSLKGFMPGPYQERLALDEVVQMMGGLAYMTGPTGQPLRAGTSAVDIAGGMFGVIGILAALRDRDETGKGTVVETALYESLVFLMGQHLCYAAQSDTLIPPMPERVSAWAVYQIFECSDGRPLFVGITTDNHWVRFCQTIGWTDFLENDALKSNGQRIDNKTIVLERFATFFASLNQAEAMMVLEKARVPFAPVQRPEDLFDDPHLAATKGLLRTQLPDGTPTDLPRLPLQIGGAISDSVTDAPPVGADTHAVLKSIGLSSEQIDAALQQNIIQAGGLA
ncbi:CaiB/BaiF CoA transferase family protein [Sulfitobacter mediterraneus]|uniref:CaiB/BaiF CoA transferase family protein n=1 Tax=Sulfitobacter mediterraneus TaxID=83219 RepID=UPI0021A6E6E0|nr:CaiB/BaiF CoA-transferase family protein [Sulfitobacter mediterraneus]UWR10329.1 CoA transferase [Sulfitobacter mediterraneus]